MIRKLLAIGILIALPWTGASANLVLNIDLSTQEFDWVNGTSITRIPGTDDDNRFGSTGAAEATITSPLPIYVGSGTNYSVAFDFAPGGTALAGLSFFTTRPPGWPASLSGDLAGPSLATFGIGDFSLFAGLSPGSFDFAPVMSNWFGVVTVNITASSIPEPASFSLLSLGLGLALLARRHARRVA